MWRACSVFTTVGYSACLRMHAFKTLISLTSGKVRAEAGRNKYAYDLPHPHAQYRRSEYPGTLMGSERFAAVCDQVQPGVMDQLQGGLSTLGISLCYDDGQMHVSKSESAGLVMARYAQL